MNKKNWKKKQKYDNDLDQRIINEGKANTSNASFEHIFVIYWKEIRRTNENRNIQ